MDNYIVSARKYRPATFHSVIGQKSLTTTLKNAIENNKLAHAYLFCGPRGVGKTTCARIFAKTINCLNIKEDGEACNACESCQAFNENRSYNIYELDAASNNSVDDIRALTEQVRIPPQIGKYKVYIIDEVHMLSTQAFNAFLKTLEEPPRHAVFILATTEKHKIIPTILSRCQIYDFNRISINDMVEYLEYVAKNENIRAEKEALNMIAQKADGGMRDALSIFDQVVSFSGQTVTYQSVIQNLNVLDYEHYFNISAAVLNKEVSQSLLILNDIFKKGFDGQQIITGLTNFFRDLLVCKDPQTIVLFELGDAVKDKYTQLARQFSDNFLYKAIEWSNECDLNYRYSKNKRLLIELLLIRLCQSEHQSLPIDDKKKIKIEPLKPSSEKSDIPETVEKEQPQAVADSRPSPVISTEEKKEGQSIRANTSSLEKNKLRIPIKKTTTTTTQEEKNAEEQENKKIFQESFSKEDLEKAWKEYASTEQDAHLKNTILNVLPQLLENNKILISVFNPDQQSKLQDKKEEMKDYLSRQLKNNRIELDIQITENKNEFIPYTNRDKFDYMIEKNPSLLTLVKNFNLRFD
ncbi:MAG: DNA polymerase III subunit gamma/tau [Dysgonamonadaceae bacterium]|jgi:DNA polymerase-3 subunit gamma/tau|nr:DNA polymerase III subunit gamma/tau [Dysgonamonadaceae bacterium]